MATEDRARGLGPAFTGLLQATAISNLGDGIRLAALPLLAESLTSSEVLVAGVTAAQFLPWLTFGPIGGVIVDRADRRRLILITQAWRAATMVALGAVVVADMAAVWMIYLVAFAITVGEILVDPSLVATVPAVVERRDLDRANGRLSSVELVTNDLVGAPTGAGLFIFAPWLPFVIDGVSYFASILPFRRLPTRSPASASDVAEASAGGVRDFLGELPVGLRWLVRHPMLGPWTAGVAVFNLGAAAGFSLLVLLVLDVHAGSEWVYAAALTGAALAGAIGSSLAPRLARRFGRPPVLLAGAAVNGVGLVALAGAPSAGAVVALWTVIGGTGGMMMAIGRGYVQRYCPDEIIGRAAIAQRTVTRTAFVIGALVGGVVASLSGIPTSYAVAGVVQLAALAPMALGLRHDEADS